MNDPIAYLNGKWVNPEQLVIPVDDPGFLWGATVSERLRTFGGQVYQLQKHLARLEHSLAIIGLSAEAVRGEVESIVPEVAQRTVAGLEAGDDIGIVVFVTPPRRGEPGNRAGYGMLAIYARPLEFADWARKYQEGERLVVSDHTQVPPTCWPSELKCRSRMHYFLADEEARRRDPGARALLLDQHGRVAEASTANVLLVRDGTIHSPLADYILPGVSLGVVQQLASTEGVAFRFTELFRPNLSSADEILLASTSPCLLPVCYCDGRPVGSGSPGPVFERMIVAWGKRTGHDIRRQAERFSDR